MIGFWIANLLNTHDTRDGRERLLSAEDHETRVGVGANGAPRLEAGRVATEFSDRISEIRPIL